MISGNRLSSGDRTTTFAPGSPASLLRSYLIFVRDLRGQRREPSIELRTEDVHVIAAHLGVTEEVVLGGLLDLMGATRAQRTAMLAMLAAGALTVVLSGSIVTSLSTDGVSVEMGRLAHAVQAAVTPVGPEATAATEGTANRAASRAIAARAWAVSDAASVAPAASAIRPTTAPAVEAATDSTTHPAGATRGTPDVIRSASSAAPPTGTAQEPPPEVPGTVEAAPGAPEPVSIGIAPDGSLVGSVAPPVPQPPVDEPTATAELPDGTVVGVGAPPVPPAPLD